ncbi:MAG: hypothetical protein AB1757_30885 [Acidobacteriota bacterium]
MADAPDCEPKRAAGRARRAELIRLLDTDKAHRYIPTLAKFDFMLQE